MNSTKLRQRAAGRRGFAAREAYALVRALLRETDGRGPLWEEFDAALCDLLGQATEARWEREDKAQLQVHETWLRRQLATLNRKGEEC
jgi:hypothetical protein